MKNHQPFINLQDLKPQPDSSPLRFASVLNQLNSLTTKIGQGEYSPRNIPQIPDASISTSTVLQIMASACFFMLGSRLKTDSSQVFVLMELVCLLALFSYFYIFIPKNNKILQKQLWIFFLLRLVSTNVLKSSLVGSVASYQQYIDNQEHESLLNLFLTMLAAFLMPKDVSVIKKYLSFHLLTSVLKVSTLQIWFQVLDYTVLLRHIALFLSFIAFYKIVSTRVTMDRQFMEATVTRHCEEISQELNEIKQKLEEESKDIFSNELKTSKVDELIMKIKYLKFALHQKEKEKPLGDGRQVFANTRRRTYMDKCQDSNPYTEKIRDDTRLVCGLKKQASSSGSTRDIKMKWRLSVSDCDDLLELILKKQVFMWYPEVLKAKENQKGRETAEFLKQHFTEVGSSLLKMNLREGEKSPSKSPKAFECSPWSSYLETNICTWNFDMLKFKELTRGNHMIEFGSAIMKKFNSLKALNTNPATAISFLTDVSDSYLPNPYHNSIHGVDVCNAVSYFLSHPEFGGNFSELEKSCLLVSALVHDIGHPGVNNAFMVAAMATEALIYNDQSVLENFHAASFFKILQKSSSNILANLSEKDYKYFRKLSINLIIDTDLTKHFIILSKFKNNELLNLSEENDRFLSLSIALKCADVSHGAKELNLHKRWSRRITEEFFSQGDKERELNIPVSPLCDRTGNISKRQHDFINFIVLPLFEALDQKFFNEEMKRTVSDQIRKNLQYWKEEIPKEEEGEKNFMKETEKVLEEIAEEAAIGK